MLVIKKRRRKNCKPLLRNKLIKKYTKIKTTIYVQEEDIRKCVLELTEIINWINTCLTVWTQTVFK